MNSLTIFHSVINTKNKYFIRSDPHNITESHQLLVTVEVNFTEKLYPDIKSKTKHNSLTNHKRF